MSDTVDYKREFWKMVTGQDNWVEPATPYQDEENAYRAYIAAYDAKPWSQKKENEAFQAWFNLWSQLRKQDRALLLVERMAERYPPGAFVYESMGDQVCIFCGWVDFEPEEEHKPDCIAVLIQGFKR